MVDRRAGRQTPWYRVSTQASERKIVERRIINPWTWQDQMGYVQANEVGGVQRTIYLAGQTSVDEEGRPVHPEDMGAQLGQAIDNVETVLREAGAELSDVVRLNIYVTDVDRFFEAYGAAAGRLAEAGCRPASTLLGVERLAYPELLVEIEATAVA
jgi:enamine deaminase RidA (YjgF/YER057c/UK114 family)